VRTLGRAPYAWFYGLPSASGGTIGGMAARIEADAARTLSQDELDDAIARDYSIGDAKMSVKV
jgi:hypothetical protein